MSHPCSLSSLPLFIVVYLLPAHPSEPTTCTCAQNSCATASSAKAIFCEGMHTDSGRIVRPGFRNRRNDHRCAWSGTRSAKLDQLELRVCYSLFGGIGYSNSDANFTTITNEG